MKMYVAILFVLASLGSLSCYAESPFHPWDFTQSYDSQKSDAPGSVWILARALDFFQNYISAVDGDRCSMYPTCSAYSREALMKHGLLPGLIMTTDRIIHESDQYELSPHMDIGGRIRSYDPVRDNDFWWYQGDR